MQGPDPRKMTDQVPTNICAESPDRTHREVAERALLAQSRRSREQQRVVGIANTVLESLPMKMSTELAQAWEEMYERTLDTAR